MVNTGPGFKAKLKFYHCKSSYDCITACPEQAITKGADRFPSMACVSVELLPGKAEIDPANVPVAASVFLFARTMHWKW